MDKKKETDIQAVVVQTTFYNSEEEQTAHINILMNLLEHPDPFVAYQASEVLYGYINMGYANRIADVLHHRQTRVHETTNTNILELVHVMLKHVRKQLSSGSHVNSKYVMALLQLFPVFNKLSTDHFNAMSSPTPNHIWLVIDLFKLLQLGQQRFLTSLDSDCLYRTLPLSITDIGKIGEGLKSNNIIVVRKGLELLWRNVHVTDVASTIELTLSVSMDYLFTAFNASNDMIMRLAQIDTEFFYSPLSDHIAVDRESLKRAMKTCLASFVSALRLISSGTHYVSSVYHSLGNAISQIHDVVQGYCHQNGKPALVDLFMNICGNEDNDMVAIQHGLLELAVTASKLVNEHQCIDMEGLALCEQIVELVDPQETDGGIKHAELFVHILFRMGLDHTTLLDMLISADTQFLKFFLHFLRYAEDNMQDFKLACARAAADLLHSEEDEGDQSDDEDTEEDDQMLEIVSELLQALYEDLKMSEFPYNPKVLMMRIQNVIDKLSTDL